MFNTAGTTGEIKYVIYMNWKNVGIFSSNSHRQNDQLVMMTNIPEAAILLQIKFSSLADLFTNILSNYTSTN